MAHTDDFIWVVTSDQEDSGQEYYKSPDRGIREITEKAISKGIKIPAEKLKSSFQGFFRNVISLIDEIPEGELPYVIDEIEIQAEISAEGEVRWVPLDTTRPAREYSKRHEPPVAGRRSGSQPGRRPDRTHSDAVTFTGIVFAADDPQGG